ncbi:MAG: T9SS type A sorting domain-containing protein [Flavobacterium sp.]|nr:MAG: T9SS type A sorting domain-containing protein [Flavobacterium sp.]
MKSLFLILALLIVGSAHAANYYFSTSIGDDSRTAIQAQNPSTPWKTLKKLNAFFTNIQPGDSVLFKRGDVWRESLTIIGSLAKKDKQIILSAYGIGNKPVISGADKFNNWTKEGMYYYMPSLNRPKYVFTDNIPLVSTITKAALSPGSFYWDGINSRIYIRLKNDANPSSYNIEASLRNYGIQSSSNHLIFDGLQVEKINDKGIHLINGRYNIIKNCTVKYVCSYGIYLQLGNNTVTGNLVDNVSGHAIEAYNNHNEINGNTIINTGKFFKSATPSMLYPAGITLSISDSSNVHDNIIGPTYGNGSGSMTHGIYIADNSTNINVYGNTVFDNTSGDGIKFATNGNIYGNICYNNSGAGIGVHDNTHHPLNVNIYRNICYNNLLGAINQYGKIADVNLKIYNNTFYKNGSQRGEIFIGNNVNSAIIKNNIIYANENSNVLTAYGIQDNLQLANNIYFNNHSYDSRVIMSGGRRFTLSQWKALSFNDNSIIADPLFVDEKTGKFQLQILSPAVDAGTYMGFSFNGTAPDIGAFELQFLTLPLKFLHFEGKNAGKNVFLMWETANEVNVSYFEVLRSSDGHYFEEIGRKTANNKSTLSTYSFSDDNTLYRKNYYRIKAVEKDGKTTYSKIIIVSFFEAANFQLSPNPVTDKITVALSASQLPQNATLYIRNISGIVIKKIPVSLFTEKMQVDVSKISSGTYFASLIYEGTTINKKFVKQ